MTIEVLLAIIVLILSIYVIARYGNRGPKLKIKAAPPINTPGGIAARLVAIILVLLLAYSIYGTKVHNSKRWIVIQILTFILLGGLLVYNRKKDQS